MAVLTIRQGNDPILRQVARPIRKIGPQTRQLLRDMAETMYDARGVGLAAPQVGISRRIIIVDAGEGLLELLNPQIVSREGNATDSEGCLSLPGLVGDVERSARVRVTGLDRNGHQVWIDGEGLLARVLQHEIDHLDGILFIDRARNIREARMEEEEAGEREPVEVKVNPER